MAGSDGVPRPVKDSEHRMSVLPDRLRWRIVLLLLLIAAGFIISRLAGPLGAAMEACLLALWAVPTVAVAIALVKPVSSLWSKRRGDQVEPPAPETDTPEPAPETGEIIVVPNGQRRRRSRRWVLSIETFVDEDGD
jgi:hypothetical protein